MFLKEENWIFAKSLAEEVKAAGWIPMEILEAFTSSPVLLGSKVGNAETTECFFPFLPSVASV